MAKRAKSSMSGQAPAADSGEMRDDDLIRSPERLRSIFEIIPDPFWAFYFDARPGYISIPFCGYSLSEWADGGLDLMRSAHSPRSGELFERAIDQVRETGEPVLELNLQVKHKNHGEDKIFAATFEAIRDDADQIIGIQGVHRDITKLVATKKILREKSEHFVDIVSSVHDLVWSTDREGNWVYLNQAAESIYGYKQEQLLEQTFMDFTDVAYLENDQKIFEQVLQGKEFLFHETVHIRADGSQCNLSFNIKPRLDSNWNILGAMGTARDITKQKFYQEQLEHLVRHDSLTGLHNRHYFQQELERATTRIGRHKPFVGLLYIDLDNFKYINDTVGHVEGDRLLIEVSQLLRSHLRHGDILARFGGDEFTVLLQHVDTDTLGAAANSFCRVLSAFAFVHDDKAFHVSASAGAVLLDDKDITASDYLGAADLACTLAKTHGRNQSHVYNPSDEAKASMVADVGWTRKIREALDEDRFVLYLQPIVRVQDGEVNRYEVLLRMRVEGDEVIAPGAFLPAAERFGLIDAIDQWVAATAIAELGRRRDAGAVQRFAINLSGRAFEDSELLPVISAALGKSGVDPSCVTFEITETAAISHLADARMFISSLKGMGCKFALDDFGSGFSSYNYLKSLPVDYLKIDGSFVQGLADDPVDQALVQSMNQVAHALGKQTIAEFVEDGASMDLLRSFGVDYAQGFYLGPPTPMNSVEIR